MPTAKKSPRHAAKAPPAKTASHPISGQVFDRAVAALEADVAFHKSKAETANAERFAADNVAAEAHRKLNAVRETLQNVERQLADEQAAHAATTEALTAAKAELEQDRAHFRRAHYALDCARSDGRRAANTIVAQARQIAELTAWKRDKLREEDSNRVADDVAFTSTHSDAVP